MKNIVILLGILLAMQSASAAELDNESIEMEEYPKSPDNSTVTNDSEFAEIPLNDAHILTNNVLKPQSTSTQTPHPTQKRVDEGSSCCHIQ